MKSVKEKIEKGKKGVMKMKELNCLDCLDKLKIRLGVLEERLNRPYKLSSTDKTFIHDGLLAISESLSEILEDDAVLERTKSSLEYNTRKKRILYKKTLQDLRAYLTVAGSME